MPIDAKKTLQKLKGEESNRGPTSLYLDKDLLKDFKKACGNIPYSRVIEELMREFLADAKKPSK